MELVLLLVCIFVGVALGFGYARSRLSSISGVGSDVVLTPLDVDQEISEAAQRWASDHGRPELSELLAAKVRLAWQLQEQRDRNGRRL